MSYAIRKCLTKTYLVKHLCDLSYHWELLQAAGHGKRLLGLPESARVVDAIPYGELRRMTRVTLYALVCTIEEAFVEAGIKFPGGYVSFIVC